MKVAYLKLTGEILGWGDDQLPATDTQDVADLPNDITPENIFLYHMDLADASLKLKSGTDLTSAQADILTGAREMLIAKHAGPSVNPITLGNLEGATDILVYFLNKTITSEPLTDEERAIWISFYSKVSPHFKTTLADIPNEEGALASAKATARQVEIDMKNDPDWNI